MDSFYLYLLGLLFINSVYLVGKFFLALKLGIHDEAIFLGFGKYEAIQLKLGKLKVYIGLFIPLPFLARFYKYHEGAKVPITYEWQLYDRPWYSRLFATFGGSISALLVSMLIFSVLSYQEVDTYLSKEELNKYGIFPSRGAFDQGFKKGDKILQINGQEYERFGDVVGPRVLSDDQTEYKISRDGEVFQLSVLWLDVVDRLDSEEFFLVPNSPYRISTVIPGKAAESAGILPGDVILSINDQPVSSMKEMQRYFQEFRNESVLLKIQRDERVYRTELAVDEDGKIGFYAKSIIKYSYVSKTLWEALSTGIKRPFRVVGVNLKAFTKIFTGDISPNKNLNGPVGISGLFDSGPKNFFRVSALLLALVFFWDFLPMPRSAALKSIPILIEVIIKKKVSLQDFNSIRKAGWALIITFMIATIVSDIMKFL